MKYKQGEKMIVEITEVKENSYILKRIGEVEPMETKIRRQAAEITRLLAENKKLKEEYNQTFKQGTEAAWELARKITCQPINGGFKRSEFEEIFEDSYISDIFEGYTYQEAAAKVAEWEKAKEEIKVGDVVSREGFYGVVKSVSDDWLNGITASGVNFQWLKCKCTKTGRHIDIDGFLKQIGEEQE